MFPEDLGFSRSNKKASEGLNSLGTRKDNHATRRRVSSLRAERLCSIHFCIYVYYYVGMYDTCVAHTWVPWCMCGG